MQKISHKSNLVTISGLSDESGLDRRTIGKYVREAGLKPVHRKRGAAYYDRTELLGAVSEVIRRKQDAQSASAPQLTPSQNLLRLLADQVVKTVAWDCGGRIALIARMLAEQYGMPTKNLNKMACMTWMLSCDSLWQFVKYDRFNDEFKFQTDRTLDEMWQAFGHIDNSKPAEKFEISIPPKIQEFADELGFQFKDPFPFHSASDFDEARGGTQEKKAESAT